ncbi:unnamed protein product [Ostreobium quekettii]|uniref:Protein kinase domain-containing protein n=1 Tax=Ostreobium quekettii TaxID=121088 RepID=A0A8S1IS01_9CHLO|nr:unnamed protein product [Ostreobium quekettii]
MSHFPLSFPNIIVLQRIPDIHPWIKSVVYQQGSSQESGLEAVEIDDLASIPEVKLTATAVTSFVGGYLYSRQDSAAIAVITAIIAIALGMLFCCGVVGRRPGDDIGPGPVDSVRELLARIDEVGEMLPNIRYNVKILAFLHACMTKLKNVHEFPKNPDKWNELVKAIHDGKELTLRHTGEFDLWNYYTVDETMHLVNEYCEYILGWAYQRGVAANTQKSVPECDAQEDRTFLEQHLGYVVGVLGPNSIDDRFREGWATARLQLEEQLQFVQRISRNSVDWEGKTDIAAGGQGKVYMSSWNGTKVALKVPKDGGRTGRRHVMLTEFWAEAALTTASKHAHVVCVLAMSGFGDSSGVDPKPFLVMELATENLGQWYQQCDPEAWPLKCNVLLQAAKGLCHLHSNGVVHRDVKPQNILVFSDGQDGVPVIKLCDLGVAVGQSASWRRTTLKDQPGTTLYQAPELFDGKRSSPESDVFSFGVVMNEVLAGKELRVYGLTAKLKGKLPLAIPDTCPGDLKRLIQRCLSPDPNARPAMIEVKEILTK